MKKCPLCNQVLIRKVDDYCINCTFKLEEKNEQKRPDAS